jgi:protein NEDD1
VFCLFNAMVVAISTTDALSILDSKRTLPIACIALNNRVASSAWSSDNAFLFLASAQTIHRYDPASNSLTDLYSTGDLAPISNIVYKDKGSLIFSAGEHVHLLDCGSTPKISQTFDSHKSQITSLSLSNDASLLSSTSATAAHVHNLALNSHTTLRGLPSGGQAITTSVFHTQLRTRLLLCIGKQLVVYDTTRPSGPIKTVALSETSSGDITAVACSPFSKTLVAVATTGGSVGLIDLEKEKG